MKFILRLNGSDLVGLTGTKSISWIIHRITQHNAPVNLAKLKNRKFENGYAYHNTKSYGIASFDFIVVVLNHAIMPSCFPFISIYGLW